MNNDVKVYLEDIAHSIIMIDQFTNNVSSFQQYQNNPMLKSAIQWQLSVIGEALNNALKTNPDLNINNARKIVDMRNKLIHGYDEVEDNVVWNVIMKYVPILKKEVADLLK